MLLDSPQLRQELGKIGEERIRNSLAWDYSKENLYKAYKKVFEEC